MTLPVADRITSLLTTFLDVQSRRSQVTASNIANAETPGYAARELDFAEHLRGAARRALAPASGTQEAATFSDGLRVVEREGATARLDGNTVDVAREMSTLAEAGMQYTAGTQLLQSRLRTLRAAIREGR